MRTTLGGNQNLEGLLHLTCTASSAYQALLDTLTSSGENLSLAKGEPVVFTFANNYEVGRPADNAVLDGVVESAERQSDGTYKLTVAVLQVKPSGDNTTYKKPTAVVQMNYRSGATLTLGKPVVADSTSAYDEVEDSAANADGLGAIISKDTTALTVDVLV